MAHGQGGAEVASERSPTLTCNHEAPIIVHGTQDPCVSRDAAFALGRNNGGENVIAIQDCTGREKMQNGKGWNDDGSAYTVDTQATQGVAFAFAQNTRNELRIFGGDGQVVGALAAQPGMKQTSFVAMPVFPLDLRNALRDPEKNDKQNRQGSGCGLDGDPAPTLTKAHVHGFASEMAVRRLTPVECERLQGFPDGWTLIPTDKRRSLEADMIKYLQLFRPELPFAEIQRLAADGPRYKALGNSMAVPVMPWLGKRISEALKGYEEVAA